MNGRHQILLGSSLFCACAIAIACSSTDQSGSGAAAGSGGTGAAGASTGGTGASAGQAETGGQSAAGTSSSAGSTASGGAAGATSETTAGAAGADEAAGSGGAASGGSAGSSAGDSAAGTGGTSAGGASSGGTGGGSAAGGAPPLLKNGSFEDGGLAPWLATATPKDDTVTPSQLGKAIYTQWANAQGVSADGKYEVSFWNGMYAFTGDLHQTVTGLAPGNYQLTLYIAFGGGINQAYLYAIGCGAQDVQQDLPLTSDYSTFKLISIPSIAVSETSCTVGIYADMNVGNWLNADAFVLEPVPG